VIGYLQDEATPVSSTPGPAPLVHSSSFSSRQLVRFCFDRGPPRVSYLPFVSSRRFRETRCRFVLRSCDQPSRGQFLSVPFQFVFLSILLGTFFFALFRACPGGHPRGFPPPLPIFPHGRYLLEPFPGVPLLQARYPVLCGLPRLPLSAFFGFLQRVASVFDP